jgi:hypothetical protein
VTAKKKYQPITRTPRAKGMRVKNIQAYLKRIGLKGKK